MEADRGMQELLFHLFDNTGLDRDHVHSGEFLLVTRPVLLEDVMNHLFNPFFVLFVVSCIEYDLM